MAGARRTWRVCKIRDQPRGASKGQLFWFSTIGTSLLKTPIDTSTESPVANDHTIEHFSQPRLVRFIRHYNLSVALVHPTQHLALHLRTRRTGQGSGQSSEITAYIYTKSNGL
jgi:hypothetical protein